MTQRPGHQDQIETLSYVVAALRNHEQMYRRSHWPVPDGVAALVEEIGFRVTRGHPGSRVARSEHAEHVATVSPLAVSYTTAADMLEVSVSTIKRLIRDGSIPAVSMGGNRRIRVSDLQAFLQRGGTR